MQYAVAAPPVRTVEWVVLPEQRFAISCAPHRQVHPPFATETEAWWVNPSAEKPLPRATPHRADGTTQPYVILAIAK